VSSWEFPIFARVNPNSNDRPSVPTALSSLASEQVSPSKFTYEHGVKIFGESEPADHVYQVIKGAVRSYKLLSDGRRQIGAFHFPGDSFGVENGDVHRFTCEAIVATTVWFVKRRRLDDIALTEWSITDNLRMLVTKNLQHAEDHMLLLGRKTSLEKVAAFLLEMDPRLAAAEGVIELPMCRRDIADYLGLTLETVSRELSFLQKRNILRFVDKTQRQLKLLDRQRLLELGTECSRQCSSYRAGGEDRHRSGLKGAFPHPSARRPRSTGLSRLMHHPDKTDVARHLR